MGKCVCILILFLDRVCPASGSIFNLDPANAEIDKVLNRPVMEVLVVDDETITLPSLSHLLGSVSEGAKGNSLKRPFSDPESDGDSTKTTPQIQDSVPSEGGGATGIFNVLDMKLEQYIHSELAVYKFKSIQHIAQLRTCLSLIASNDFDGFMKNENQFESVFRHKPHLLRRQKSYYLAHYIIRFGATEFLDYLATRCPAFSLSLRGDMYAALIHLVQTKPLKTVICMLSGKRSFSIKHLEALSASVRRKYDHLHYLDNIYFEYRERSCSGLTLAMNILNSSDTSEKHQHLCSLLAFEKYNPGHVNESLLHKRLLLIPKHNPELFASLDIDLKYFLARRAVILNKIDVFEVMLELEPALLLHISHEYTINETLLALAIEFSLLDFVSYILDVVPELATTNMNGLESAVDLAIKHEKIGVLGELESKFGISYKVILLHEGVSLNALQYSFKTRKCKVFAFYVTKMTKECALKNLLYIFGSPVEIFMHALSATQNNDFYLARILVNVLDFKPISVDDKITPNLDELTIRLEPHVLFILKVSASLSSL
jgi:hypothetical protein